MFCNAVVVPRSHSCVGVCCCYPRRDRHPASSPFSQTSLANCCDFVFWRSFTISHQRLQPLTLSLRCPHSLCNAVGGQHSPRKPRRGAGRLSTTPDTKTSHPCLSLGHYHSARQLSSTLWAVLNNEFKNASARTTPSSNSFRLTLLKTLPKSMTPRLSGGGRERSDIKVSQNGACTEKTILTTNTMQ